MYLKENILKKMILSAFFLAIGIVLPFFTSQIKEIGDSLLPMHIPVMLCGLICGPQNGLIVGLFLPILRALAFSMPPLFPNAIWMSLELATYGLIIGLLYLRPQKRTIGYLYFCLIVSMISGRIVWGIAKTVLLGLNGKVFTMQAFIVGGLVDAVPGIILQLIIIPFVMVIVNSVNFEIKNNI